MNQQIKRESYWNVAFIMADEEDMLNAYCSAGRMPFLPEIISSEMRKFKVMWRPTNAGLTHRRRYPAARVPPIAKSRPAV